MHIQLDALPLALKLAFLYLLAMNIAGFVLMAVDKRRAIEHRWRIRESTLLLAAALGGSLGSLLGMLLLRHKTKHPAFRIGLPAMLAVHCALVILYLIESSPLSLG